MSRRARENLLAAGILAVFVGVIVLCQDFGPRARMIPLPLAIFGVVLTIVQIAWQNLGSTDALRMDMIEVKPHGGADGPAPAPRPDSRPDSRPSGRREAAAYGMVAALLALVLLLGPMPAITLFTAGYLIATRHYSWRAGLIYTAIFAAAVYGLFFVALEIQPYHGLLEPLVAAFE